MEPIAKNHITITPKLFQEGRLASRGYAYKRGIRNLILILALVFVVTGAWMLRTSGSVIYLAGELIFVCAILAWIVFVQPRSGNKKKFQAMANGSGRNPERDTVFYKDHFVVTAETGKTMTVYYKDILGIFESRNLWVINCQDKVSVLLKKDGFSMGDMNTIKEYMGECM
ncbi:MAG TPA: YcxB family protein [Candidatus Limivivens intestinipullorum]|uniref:YcxB family protein n=1 Tax=Candidatus Limivivens intestinipullorum TaxID=2840858 RepID=A0A9D1JKP1_9FIRM|nr:YcxB family protein [Candidatus Limivivens intestinipullorum]